MLLETNIKLHLTELDFWSKTGEGGIGGQGNFLGRGSSPQSPILGKPCTLFGIHHIICTVTECTEKQYLVDYPSGITHIMLFVAICNSIQALW